MTRLDATVMICTFMVIVTGSIAPAQPSVEAAVLRRATQSFELARWDLPTTWHLLLAAASGAESRAAIVTALGRVGSPKLIPLVDSELDRLRSGEADPSVVRALGLSVGLLADEDLLARSVDAGLSGGELALAVGLFGHWPKSTVAPDVLFEKLLAPGATPVDAPDFLADPVVATLVHLARLDDPRLNDLALRSLEDRNTARRWAAAYRFSRMREVPPDAARRGLRALLGDADPEVASSAAKALVRCAGSGPLDALAVSDAYLGGGARIVQIDRLLALGRSQQAAGLPAIVTALESPDVHAQRAALESLPSMVSDAGERARWARRVREIVESAAPVEVRRVAVGAFASLHPSDFPTVRARWMADESPFLRAAVAQAAVASEGVTADDALSAFAEPDLRVRLAVLESARAIAADPNLRSRRQVVLDRLVDVLRDAIAGEPTSFAGDPILLGVGAGLLADLDRAEDGARNATVAEVADALADLLPPFEVEPWQLLVELAARDGTDRGTQRLRRLIDVNDQPDIQRRVRAALKERGDVPAARVAQSPIPASGRPEAIEARVTTSEGVIVLALRTDLAPATVERFARLAESGYFDGLRFHRVVPAFVAQGGCPRGDGWGGPGWTQPCEVSPATYRRGTVGMALAGKDTGGSQWFVAHRAVPHLDGRYTVFAEVIGGFEVVDALNPDSQMRAVEIRRWSPR